jgi:hypothetical protein
LHKSEYFESKKPMINKKYFNELFEENLEGLSQSNPWGAAATGVTCVGQ